MLLAAGIPLKRRRCGTRLHFPLQFLKGRMMMMAGGSVLVVDEGLPVEREI